MWTPHRDIETICAIATAPGEGAIAVIRVSGPQALKKVRLIADFLPINIESHRIYWGYLKSHDKIIDEVLISYFKEGKSFTGEESLEISYHGSQYIGKKILSELSQSGCQIAERGEFTYRAFMNQRLDLVQAESIMSLISSHNDKALQMSLRHLKGELSFYIQSIEDKLLSILAHIEANIDFTEEDLSPQSQEHLYKTLLEVKELTQKLLDSAEVGRKITQGLWVGFLGKPNVGKSLLFNTLLGDEKAIVTDIPGTTRDLLEGQWNLEGHLIKIFDSAGIRSSDDKIENIGISKAIENIKFCDIIFYILDITNIDLGPTDLDLLPLHPHQEFVFILNKTDLLEEAYKRDIYCEKLQKMFPDKRILFSNSFKKGGIEEILDFLHSHLKVLHSENSAVLMQVRHHEIISKVLESLEKAQNSYLNKSGYEFISLDLREALIYIKKLLGQDLNEDILDRVFKEFCIGK